MSDSCRILPAHLEWPKAADNLNSISRGATRIRLVTGAKGFERLAEFEQLEALWCFGIDDKCLKQISTCLSLKELYLDYKLKTADLSPLLNLPKLSILTIDSCSRMTSLEQLASFKSLVGLSIVNFKNVHDIGPLAELSNLRELAVEGSMWMRMKIDTLAPIGGLQRLEVLHLTNLKVADESLAPLASLSRLRELQIANFYPYEEFARLAAKHPQTTSQWFAPFISTSWSCKECKVGEMVMLTGKGKPMLCRRCNTQRLARHVAEFESIVQQERQKV
jgi:hypothetical protein